MEDLQIKDPGIRYIYNLIVKMLGEDVVELVDFWEADLCAVGFKKKDKLVYVSNWKFRDCAQEDMKYYAEFEVIDETTSETQSVAKVLKEVSEEVLLKEVYDYWNG
ncbi:hypothetical protein L3C95_12155 [Chitinophaga filiformis]|uniref:hypothetical protein n=1 Tax=Chitinophaga filiformis TaxID=104663 RepID=UPI001F3DB29A|nr:hypothetical protein [Chitinophaga filiformis]MCF6403634.1 hypothetical protein [Chitinophaga filiformis]